MNVKILRSYLNSLDFEKKLNVRLDRLQRAEANPVDRMNVFSECRDDVFSFIDMFGVCYEPRLQESPDLPLFLFPHQREIIYRLIDAEENTHDLLIEKTRDMMATWTVLYYMYWRWRFKDRWYGLIGSRKEAEVDNGTPQALFGKLRYIHYAMPKWMTPQGFRKSEHDIHMKLINPDQQSFLIGESANPNFARGNRAAMIFFDEMFFWRFARESWRSASDSTPCRIAVSTPAPSSFARGLRESMEVNKTLLTLDWKQHPFKDEAWYKAEEARRAADPLAVEGELNISYQADPTGAYYPSVALCPVRDYDYNPDLPLYVGLDFGAGDHTALVYFQRDAKNFYILDCMEQAQRNVHWFLPFLRHGYTFKDQDTYEVKNKFMNDTYKLEKRLYSRDQFELIQRFNTWKLPVMYCGEIAHRNRSQTGNSQVPMSVFTMLSGFGIFLRINNMGNDYPVRRTAVIRMLATAVFSSKYGALDVYDALINSRFAQGRENSTSEEAKNKPVHDEFADIRAACENYAVNMALGSGGSGVKSAPYGHHAWQSR